VDRLGPAASERDRMRAVVLALLPLDEARRTGALIRRAVPPERPAVGGWLGGGRAGAALLARLEAARAAGELRAGVDVAHEHALLAASIAGLADGVLDGAISAGRAPVQVDYLLDRSYQPAPRSGP